MASFFSDLDLCVGCRYPCAMNISTAARQGFLVTARCRPGHPVPIAAMMGLRTAIRSLSATGGGGIGVRPRRETRIGSVCCDLRRWQPGPIASFSSGSWNWSKPAPVAKASASDSSSEASTADDSASFPVDIDATVQKEVMERTEGLYSSLMPLNEKLQGPLSKHSDRGTSLPFVFLVGNHSSGKSSFINYVMGRKVQTAGVAPTDDCFTVIAPGPTDVDQDGPALVGDPDMGFAQLRQFGPTLIHHTQLKVRSDIRNGAFMMVDSPGMIDSPVSSGGMGGYGSRGGAESEGGVIMDRGYDFQGVVRWMAERADIVMLFFDPDKPGTTGETLSILLHSLSGMDHKLLIVLNKADQFRKIHDFARAYGSLCWNLSKVIPRKDLPRIYTMCLPINSQTGAESSAEEGRKEQPIGNGLADLHQTRDDVVAEVMKAPKRRIDNVITHLHDSAHLLLMHAQIVEDVRKRQSKMLWDARLQEAASAILCAGIAGASHYTAMPPELTGGAAAATILGVGGLHWFNASKLEAHEERLTTSEELSASFQRTHAREVSEANEFTASLWQRIRDPLKIGLRSTGLGNFPSVDRSDLANLRRILDEDIPGLRRLASPSHIGSKTDR